MPRIQVPTEGHVVNVLPPVDLNGSAKTGDIFHLKNYSHVDIIIQLGVTGAASTVTLKECDDVTPSASTAIAFNYYAETTAAGDTLGALTAATTSGFATSTNDNVMYVISLDASELSDGYPYLQLNFSDPAAGTIASAVAVLSGARYGEDQNATAIT